MNWKKNLLLTLLMGIILTGTFLTTPASQAAVASQGKHLKMETPTYRDPSGYAYKLGLESDNETPELEMWKIYEYNDNDQTRKNDNSTIYCLRMGVGFGSENGSPTEPRIYQKYADMKNPQNGDQDIINQYKSSVLGNSQERYNSLMWVLDHCYVPAPSTASEEAKKNAEAYKKELLNAAGIPEDSKINDDLIDIVQQVAIWYFTNTDKYKAQDITTIYVKKKDEVGDYKNLEDVFDWDLQDEVKTLYQYFIGEGEKNKNTAPSTTDATNPIQLNSTDAKVTLRKDTDGSEYYLAGPYKIEKQLEKEFTISASLNNESTFTLLNEDKQTGTDIQTLAGNGQSFYVKIPKNENTNNVENVSLTITTKVKQNTITYWEVNDNNAANEQPVVEIKPEEKVFTQEVTFKLSNFDLALRKFVTNINGKELKKDETTYTREPVIDLDPLTKASATTANYNHLKSPQGVAVGDIVIYTIRIYNEGELDGYASAITDYLPPQLEFVTDDEEHFNANYGWVLDPLDPSERTVTTNLLAKREDDNIYAEENEENMLKAFNGNSLDYKELKIKCKVVTTEILDRIITNIAEITEFTDADGKEIIDRDSQKQNANIPNETELPDYKGHNNNKSVLSDASYFYQGQQDDDDFEKLILEEFDLALRKFITKVNDTPVTSRIPKFTNVKDSNGNYIYEHSKEPIEVETTDVVEYTIRIYNEGDIAGYAKGITDNIPEGLEFLPQNEINQEYRWIMLDENGEKTEDVSKAVKITTDYLSKAQEQEEGKNLIAPFDSTKTSPDYKDVKVVFKVVAPSTYTGIITNIAEISDDSNETGNEVEDRDSIPDNNNEKEDDIDKEHLKLTYFDLALRKFITAVNDTEITNRVPKFTVTEDGKYTYEHTKEPVEVENGNIVTYTLRIYNEGTKDGYAKEIKDDLPEGLEFLPENETNKEYDWVMIDENGEETEDVSKAVSVKTDYLSKEQGDLNQRDNLLTKFDVKNMEEPDYRDIKIAFKVTEPNTSDRILINQAQISDDSDKNGKDVIDSDSTPDKWIEGEDDQDIEKVKVKYFDLSLRKWVTEAIVIDEGKETVTQTGHKAEDDPEELVKVEIKESRLNKVVVKFRYKIRVKNEGEIAGYATEISDYIPEGLKFVAEDNPSWKEVDGKIVTDALKDTLLQPGETAEVEVLLTWINGKNNFGEKINVAEISKDKNDSDTPDIDSTPNNKKPGEDDIDDAPVILSVKTGIGINPQYIIVTTISLGILTSGTILIKKYIL